MSAKATGFEFWSNVLGSPKYVAAPMVDMSELSYRLLCRRYGAQLCYSPMFHSQQFSQDCLYRSDVFSTSLDDTPLIVQFCANNPETFVNAASLVSSQCSAVDLNLGCPQAIARKGNYGAFLQDDWDLIQSMVRKASTELPIPVTCKMRILPGHFKRSVEYARMLENSGCSVLTVHSRTREQKGHATGLASWDVVKEIKANVGIPVIANGNILSFDDVKDCLEYTGADAVMSAEALLHNPALFSGENPPVWKIVEEYLILAEKFHTHIRHVRCHLFKILYLCIHQDDRITHLLTEGSSFSDFYRICNVLRELPTKDFSVQNYSKRLDAENMDCFNLKNVLSLDLSDSEFSDSCSQESELTSKLSNNEFSNRVLDHRHDTEIELIDPQGLEALQRLADVNKSQPNGENDMFETCVEEEQVNQNELQNVDVEDHLPVWLCHSRPRIVLDNKNRGCYSKYFQTSDSRTENNLEDSGLSKKKLRKERRHARVLHTMKEKRKVKKLRRKQKLAEQRENQTIEIKSTTEVKVTKKQRKLMVRHRMLDARGKAPKVCIDLSFSSEMTPKELHRLSSQLRRLYGSNRHSEKPLHVYFCNFKPSDPLYEICQRKNDGFTEYVVEKSEEEPEKLFPAEDIVYLSPDSDNVLEGLDTRKVYVICGIVDGSSKKGLSLSYAHSRNVRTAKLPIDNYLMRYSQNPGTAVLTVNQVFDILLAFNENGDWTTSLSSHVPLRKGFCRGDKESQPMSEHAAIAL